MSDQFDQEILKRVLDRAEFLSYEITLTSSGTRPPLPEQYSFFGPTVMFYPDWEKVTIARMDRHRLLRISQGKKPLAILNQEHMWVFGLTGEEDVPGEYPTGTLLTELPKNPFLTPVLPSELNYLEEGSILDRATWRFSIPDNLIIDLDQELGVVLAATYPSFRLEATSFTVLSSPPRATWSGPTVPRDEFGNTLRPPSGTGTFQCCSCAPAASRRPSAHLRN